MKPVVCVCTYKRPMPLRATLQAIAGADLHPNTELVVVDNEPSAGTREILRQVAPWAHLVDEPQRGITFARNTAIRKALALGADVISFIDDDDIPDPAWLRELLIAYDPPPAPKPDVVYGCELTEDGEVHAIRGSGNILLSREILERIGDPWFDNRFALIGGSDRDLFNRIGKIGGHFGRSDRSTIIRGFDPNRKTLRGRFMRDFKMGANRVIMNCPEMGDPPVGKRLRKFAFSIVAQMPKIITKPHKRKWRRKLLTSTAMLMGGIYASLGGRYQYYKHFEPPTHT